MGGGLGHRLHARRPPRGGRGLRRGRGGGRARRVGARRPADAARPGGARAAASWAAPGSPSTGWAATKDDPRRAHLRLGGRRHERPAAARCSTARSTSRCSPTGPTPSPPDTLRLVGKHCESGDVLVAEASLPPVGARRPGVPARPRAPTVCRWRPTTTGSPGPRCVFVDRGTRPPGDAPRDLRRPRGAGRVMAPVPRPAVRIGLLGCGTVGQAVVRTLLEGGATIERASGHRLEVGPILVRDAAQAAARRRPGAHHHRPRARARGPLGLDRRRGDGRPRSRPSATCARPSRAAPSVVTANKQLLVAPRARAARRPPRRPAPSCASRPRPAPRSRSSRCCASRCWRPRSPRSPASSTAPPTSSSPRWRAAGCPTPTRSARAQELGYAEADPTEDVNGADAAAKMAILSVDRLPLAGAPSTTCPTRASTGCRPRTSSTPRSLGFVVKLLGVARLLNGSVSVRVYPALVPRGHRLAAIGGPDNAVLLESRTTREIMLVGPGRGRRRDRLGRGGRHPVDPGHPPGLVPAQRPGRLRPHHRPARGGARRRSTCAWPWPTAPACSRAWRRCSATRSSRSARCVQSGVGRRGAPGAGAALGPGGAHGAGAWRACGRWTTCAASRCMLRVLGSGRGGRLMTALIERYREFLPVERRPRRSCRWARAAPRWCPLPRLSERFGARGPRQARGHEPHRRASRTAA